MAIIRSKSGPEFVLEAGRTFFHQSRDKVMDMLARRRAFLTTYRELSVLNDRELSDLGISRSNIKRLALEAAYDF